MGTNTHELGSIWQCNKKPAQLRITEQLPIDEKIDTYIVELVQLIFNLIFPGNLKEQKHRISNDSHFTC